MPPTAARVAISVVALVALAAPAGCGADGEAARRPVDGADLYARNCAVCHGAALDGSRTGPPLLSAVYAPAELDDAAFRDAIRGGVGSDRWDLGPMPALPSLDDAEIDAIIRFVRAEQERLGFEPAPP